MALNATAPATPTASVTTRTGALESIVAGSISGMSSVMLCHPLDVIRTRLQTNQQSQTLKQCFNSIRSEGGIASFYRGFWGPFASQGMYKSIIFGTNTLSIEHLFHNKQTSFSVFVSGFISGSVNSFVVSPIELIRTSQILGNNHIAATATIASDRITPRAAIASTSSSSVIKTLIADHGVLCLWKTVLPTALRDGPGVGFYFLVFHKSKSILSSVNESYQSTVSPAVIKIISGSLSGVAFWLWALPVDVVKTMMESSISNNSNNGSSKSMSRIAILVSTVKQLYQIGGAARFVRG